MPLAGGGSSAVLKRSLEVSGVVEAADDPPVRRDHEVRDRRVVGAGERKAPRPDATFIAWPITPPWTTATTTSSGWAAGDALDRALDSTSELVVGLGTGDHIPSTGLEHRRRQRILVGDAAAQLTAFPLAEEDLPRSGSTCGSMPSRSASGAAVSWVRRSVVT